MLTTFGIAMVLLATQPPGGEAARNQPSRAAPATLSAARQAALQTQVLERGRALTRLLLAGDAAALEPQLAPSFLQAIGGSAGLAPLVARINGQIGAEQAVLEEAAFVEAGHLFYYRVSRFERLPSATTQWVIAPDGRVIGASVRPTVEPPPSPYLDYQTRARLRLPFAAPAAGGRWYVGWGGRDAIRNYHVQAPDQRFAYDFLVSRGADVFAGDGARNEDHYCWGEPVLAPAAGTVVEAVGDVPDNARPGVQREGAPPPGNHVVLDHGGGEYSLLAHFRVGSLAVRRGQRVAAGALLGRCGNSGRSTVPHLHYHLQTGAAFRQGVGLPAFFNDYLADDRPVTRGEPVRGQRILPQRG